MTIKILEELNVHYEKWHPTDTDMIGRDLGQVMTALVKAAATWETQEDDVTSFKELVWTLTEWYDTKENKEFFGILYDKLK